jgi:hypothetical protein
MELSSNLLTRSLRQTFQAPQPNTLFDFIHGFLGAVCQNHLCFCDQTSANAEGGV